MFNLFIMQVQYIVYLLEFALVVNESLWPESVRIAPGLLTMQNTIHVRNDVGTFWYCVSGKGGGLWVNIYMFMFANWYPMLYGLLQLQCPYNSRNPSHINKRPPPSFSFPNTNTTN